MRLTRPVAISILVLLAALVLWLVAQSTGEGGGEGEGTPPRSTSSARSTDPAGPSAGSRTAEDPDDGRPRGVDTRDWDDVDACRDRDLPKELDPLIQDIESGGPYAYSGKDGSTFGNREGELPEESRGYYREFTVATPGSSDRGARRVVTGGPVESDPQVWYYTDDHYGSFCEFAP